MEEGRLSFNFFKMESEGSGLLEMNLGKNLFAMET